MQGIRLSSHFWIPLVSGATARIFSVTVVSPLELIRTKMQSKKLTYLEIGDALKLVVKKDGIRGLWRGVFPTLLRDVPFSAIYWSQYETLKKWYGPGIPSFWFSFTAEGQKHSKSQSTLEMMLQLRRQYGIRALFTGLVPRLIKVAPACAIMVSTFEHGKIVFNRLGNYKFSTSDVNAKDVNDGQIQI
ncbi:hypothetical protein FQA39_LY19020 [Lamprigera yunnana]|nr:hypothetical protein FQA39_LY19020 [Lamprigera yunnana]